MDENGLTVTPAGLVGLSDALGAGLALSAASTEAALRRPLGDLVDEVISSAAGSANTARAYRTAAGLFLQYLDRERGDMTGRPDWRPFAEPTSEPAAGGRTVKTTWLYHAPAAVLRLVDAGILDGFRAWRTAEGDGPNAASLRVNGARVFLSVAYRAGILTTEQAHMLGLSAYRQRQKRNVQPVGRRLTREEVRRLRDAPNVLTNKGKRDLAMLDLMLFAGLRREEVAMLDLSALRQDRGRWWIVLTGKGDKTRRVPVHPALYSSLAAWCAAAGLAIGGDAGGAIFRSMHRGGAITPAGINASVVGRIVAELGAAAGIAPAHGVNQLGAHDLRRTAARNAYDNGATVLQVQAMLGHADASTTSRYIGALDADKSAVDKIEY